MSSITQEDMKAFDSEVERARKKGTPLPEINPTYNEGVVIPGYFVGGHIDHDPQANYTPEWVLRYIHMKAASPQGEKGMFSLKPGDKIVWKEEPDAPETLLYYVVAQNGYHRFWELGIYMKDADGHESCLDEDEFHQYYAVTNK